ncbi:MAG: family 16 glycoside hydrolase, partial [Candidatus Korobacteraceae bacterium]
MNPTRRAIMMMLALLLAAVLAGFSLLPAVAGEDNSYVPAHGKAVVLFDASHRDQFDSFLKTNGLNSDPDHVFTFENGVIHVSGTEMGYLITKKEFADYYLRAEFKWGEATHAPREGQARDSGILYHIQGPNKV